MKIHIDLDAAEMDFLSIGLMQWGGVAAMTDDLARVVGFADAGDFFARSAEVVESLEDGRGLESVDWRRALAVAEIAYCSEILGIGHQWEDFSAFTSDETYIAMRRLQSKVISLT